MSSALSEGPFKVKPNEKSCPRESRNMQRSLGMNMSMTKPGNAYNDSLLSYAYAGASPLVHSKSKALYSFAKTNRFVPMKSFS